MDTLVPLHEGDIVRFVTRNRDSTDERIPLTKLYVIWKPDFRALNQFPDSCEVLRGVTRLVYVTVLMWPRKILCTDAHGALCYHRDTVFRDANGNKIPLLFLRTSLILVARAKPGQ